MRRVHPDDVAVDEVQFMDEGIALPALSHGAACRRRSGQAPAILLTYAGSGVHLEPKPKPNLSNLEIPHEIPGT